MFILKVVVSRRQQHKKIRKIQRFCHNNFKMRICGLRLSRRVTLGAKYNVR